MFHSNSRQAFEVTSHQLPGLLQPNQVPCVGRNKDNCNDNKVLYVT